MNAEIKDEFSNFFSSSWWKSRLDSFPPSKYITNIGGFDFL